MTQQQTVMVTPTSWEWIGQMWALFPMLLVFMVLAMAFRIASQALKPETLRELRPMAETALMARGGGRLLTGGG